MFGLLPDRGAAGLAVRIWIVHAVSAGARVPFPVATRRARRKMAGGIDVDPVSAVRALVGARRHVAAGWYRFGHGSRFSLLVQSDWAARRRRARTNARPNLTMFVPRTRCRNQQQSGNRATSASSASWALRVQLIELAGCSGPECRAARRHRRCASARAPYGNALVRAGRGSGRKPAHQRYAHAGAG